MKILVTGGTGMLGRVLVKKLSSQYEVIAVSRSGRDKTVVCDLSKEADVDNLFQGSSFGLVIHTAAYSDVDGCERDPQMAHASNGLATKFLAKNSGSRRIPFVYVSTDYVFDGRKKSLYVEEDAVGPVNIYGMTKLEGEAYTSSLAPLSAIVRTSWLFGPANPNNFVNAIIARLKKEKTVSVLADQEDSPTYVEDLSAALQKIGEHLVLEAAKEPGRSRHEIFQVCNAGSTTRYQMTLKIKELMGLKDVKVEEAEKKSIPNRLAIRPAYVAMSTKRYETFFKTKLRPWQESMKEYLDGHVLCESS